MSEFTPRAMIAIRHMKNMTQVELAKEASMSSWTISQIENGKWNPSDSEIERIRVALDWENTLAELIRVYQAYGQTPPILDAHTAGAALPGCEIPGVGQGR